MFSSIPRQSQRKVGNANLRCLLLSARSAGKSKKKATELNLGDIVEDNEASGPCVVMKFTDV